MTKIETLLTHMQSDSQSSSRIQSLSLPHTCTHWVL